MNTPPYYLQKVLNGVMQDEQGAMALCHNKQ